MPTPWESSPDSGDPVDCVCGSRAACAVARDCGRGDRSLVAALYLTSSRASALAVGLGLAVMVAIDRNRGNSPEH
jgi:hypothetical protein